MSDKSGTIITCYSYKGGSGRSMALANLAWILASNGYKVLAIDWDLEAPGLHRYFQPFLIDADLRSSEGLIDFVWDLAALSMTPPESDASESTNSLEEAADITEYAIRLQWKETEIEREEREGEDTNLWSLFPGNGKIDFIPAGSQGSVYAKRVNSFDWDDFYERLGGGSLLNRARQHMKASYDYILIDSRTGVSDTSGICTVQMPDILAVFFTLNNQSLLGAEAVASSVRTYPERKDKPVRIFPILTRLDPSEKVKLDAGRQEAKIRFSRFLDHLSPNERDDYWGSIGLPYIPFYSYEEVLAVFGDPPNQIDSLLSSYERFVGYLTEKKVSELKWTNYDKNQRNIQCQQAIARYTRKLIEQKQSLSLASSSLAQLVIVANQDGTVKVNGRAEGVAIANTPLILENIPGTHIIQFLAEGYEDWSEVITLQSGQSDVIQVALEPLKSQKNSLDKTSVSVNILTELFRESLRGMKSFDLWIRGRSRAYDPLGYGVRAYAEKMFSLYNQMQIFGQTKSRPLYDIYINVNILKDLTNLQRFSAEELQEVFGKDSRTLGRIRETVLGIKAINSNHRLTILGKPGAGKTTFLKLITLYALTDQLKFRALPIFVNLKDWFDSQQSLLEYIIAQFDIMDFPNSEEFVTRLLSRGKCILLFDGYDEIPNPLQHSVRGLDDFLKRFDKNRYVLSCQIGAYHHTFTGFNLVEIADFTHKQIESFVQKWFDNNPEQGKRCWNRLIENNSVMELATTPLLLTMLCIQFEEAMEFPENRAELYQDAILALLKKWDASRSIERTPVYKNLSLAGKESLLSHLAYNSFINDEYFIPQRVLELHITEYIEGMAGVEAKNLNLDSNKILKAIESNHGLLVERAHKVYSFSHLTFQEYFTSKYIIEHRIEESLVAEHLFDPKWREILLLTAGLLSSRTISDVFSKSIRKEIKRYYNEKLLKGPLDTIYSAVKKESPYSPSLSKALAIYLVLTQSPDSSSGLSDLARMLVQQLDSTLNLSIKDSIDVYQNIFGHHYQAKKLDLELGQPMEANLFSYLSANLLLLDCLKTSYTSKKTRNELIAELLDE